MAEGRSVPVKTLLIALSVSQPLLWPTHLWVASVSLHIRVSGSPHFNQLAPTIAPTFVAPAKLCFGLACSALRVCNTLPA